MRVREGREGGRGADDVDRNITIPFLHSSRSSVPMNKRASSTYGGWDNGPLEWEEGSKWKVLHPKVCFQCVLCNTIRDIAWWVLCYL